MAAGNGDVAEHEQMTTDKFSATFRRFAVAVETAREIEAAELAGDRYRATMLRFALAARRAGFPRRDW